ncbi:MAG: hypothetical protein JWO86_7094 [Myxococcaceae bacterium]|nr:hypothetical protein [Myxococcaceae bacterium]
MATVTFGDDFEWDDAKAAANVRKHRGVSFVEAVSALADASAVEYADTGHADRLLTLGMSGRARVVLVVTTEAAERTRIISARRATATERMIYEEG